MESGTDGLKREIGTWGLSASIINGIVGAGIFVLPAVVAEGLGAAGILAYLFCGFLVALVMLCFAEAGSKVATSGGAYAFIETAFGRYPGFLTSMLSVAGTIASDAAIANALADIARPAARSKARLCPPHSGKRSTERSLSATMLTSAW